jgi:hypothetical protein
MSIKYWNVGLNAHGSIIFLIAVHTTREVNWLKATMEKRIGSNLDLAKFDVNLSFNPPLNPMNFFNILKKCHILYEQTGGLWCCVFLSLRIYLL